MTRRTATWLAWSLFGAWVALQMATLALVAHGVSTGDDFFGLAMVGFAAVGALVAAHRPGNAVGWLLLAIALSLATQVLGEAYVVAPTYPGRLVVAWFTSWMWFVWLVLVGIFVPLLFPTGRLLSHRWRPVAWLAAAGLTSCVIGAAFEPGPLALTTEITNPLAAKGTAAEVVKGFTTLGLTLVTAAFILGAVSLAVRFRRAQGVERQQLKWFALVGLIMLGGLSLGFLALPLSARWEDVFGSIGWSMFLFGFIVGIPVATGIAILRHRLYDIDVVINRALVYGSLTAILAATYLGTVLVLRVVLDPITGESDLAVAGSTLAVAALVRPLRSRIQATVDRRFYRSRYDAGRTLEAFTGRLRDQIDLEALGTDLRTVVHDTVHPAHVSLWLRRTAR
jgi:hypothetical protein